MLVRKKLAVSIAVMLAMAAGGAVAASVNGDYKGHPIVKVVVNGKTVQGDVPGINMEGTTLVPLRVVSESLGAQVGWDPATSTASVTLAASAMPVTQTPVPAPTLSAKQKLLIEVRNLYADNSDYAGKLGDIREKIRIGKEFYDIKKNDFYLAQMNDAYWKTFEDRYFELVSAATAIQEEAGKSDVSLTELFQATDKIHAAYGSYRLAVIQLKQFAATGRTEFLDNYIVNYSRAFDEELEAKKIIADGMKKLK